MQRHGHDWLSTWTEPLLLVLFAVAVRLPGFPASVLAWDESMLILMAHAMLHGQLPYVVIFDDKSLGEPALLAAGMAVLGESVVAVRLLATLAVGATGLVLRSIALRAGMSRGAALASGLLYAAFSTSLDGLSAMPEIVLAPFTTGAAAIAVAHLDTAAAPRQLRAVAAMGLACGVAIWIKSVAVPPACMLFVLLVGGWLLRRRTGVVWALALAATYAVTCLLPTALTGLYYVWRGQWDAFWYCNFGFMPGFLGHKPGWPVILRMTADHLLDLWPLLVLAGFAVVLRRAAPALVIAMLLWLAAEFVAAVAPLKFFGHYFLLLLPPLCVLSALTLDVLARRTMLAERRSVAPAIVALCVALVPLTVVARLLIASDLDIRQPDKLRQAASLIRNDATPGATLWVVNENPIINFLADVPSPTRFMFPQHLVGDLSGMTGIDPATEVQRVLSERPRYIVVAADAWVLVEPALRPLIHAAIDSDYQLTWQVPRWPMPLEIYKLRN